MVAQHAPQHAAQVPVSSFSFEAFAAVTDRIETVLDVETEALLHNRPFDLADVSLRKRQGLLELSRFMARLAVVGEQEQARARLATLAIKLERNQSALDVQLRAVREVSDIIARTMKDAESDGTYSNRPARS